MKILSALCLLVAALHFGACRPEARGTVRNYHFPTSNTPLDSISGAAEVLDSIALQGTAQDKALAAIYHAVHYDRMGQYKLGKKAGLTALGALKGISDDRLYNKIYRLLGDAASALGEYPEALQMLSKALGYAKNDSATQSIIYAGMGQVFQLKYEPEEAKKYLRQALAISGSQKESKGYLLALHTLANTYGMAGNLDSALLLDEEGLAISRRAGLRNNEGSFLDNKAHCFLVQEQFDSARYYFKESLTIDMERGENRLICDTWLSLGVVAQYEEAYPEAIRLLKDALAQANAINYRNGAMVSWRYLSDTYRDAGDFQKALAAYEMYTNLKDSLLNEKKDVAIAEWKAIYETEKKEEELRIQGLKLQRRNTVITLGSVSMVFLFSAVYFANRRSKLRKEKRYQEELFAHDQEASLKILIAEETERRRIAADLHDGVGQTLTAAWLNLQATQPLLQKLHQEAAKLIQTTTQLVGDSCSEVRQISHNMMPTALFQKGLPAALEEMLRRINPKHLTVSFSADGYNPHTEKTTELVLYRVIQECVNNTVRHAAATALFISLQQEENQLAVFVEDNGVGMGRLPAQVNDGIGLQNIKSRVQYLRGSVEWHAVNPDGSGTIVEIFIPLSS